MGKNPDPRFGINNQDHISESFETIFGLKYFNSLMCIRDLGWKKFGPGIREKHPGSATLKIIEAVPVVRGEGGQDRVHRQGKVGLCELKDKC
jgi:hypothetical protein